MYIKAYCKFLVVLHCFLLCFGFVSIVGASDVSIETEQVTPASPTSSPQSYLDWRDIDWKDPFLKHGQVSQYTSSKVPPNAEVSEVLAQVAKSESKMKQELKKHSSTSIITTKSNDD